MKLIGIFMVLHGMVHGLYFGQSIRLFELRPGMVWPDGSWAFSRLLKNKAIRFLAGVSCLLADIGFVAGGVGVLMKWSFWSPVAIVTSIFSSLIFIIFWDGKLNKLNDKGGLAILINAAILTAIFVF
ncbi:MAG: hypothetical protein GF421_08595 [Candidatus Aminicenantes bacterium]|nr:hypothetical protein [Candidatus Aminicenantes bacterium]